MRSLASWTAPDGGDIVWFVPASLLNNQSYIRHVEEWVEDGGHLVVLVEHADTETNDWSRSASDPSLEPALLRMLQRVGIKLEDGEVFQKPGEGV